LNANTHVNVNGFIGLNANTQLRFKGINDVNHYIGYSDDNNIDGVRIQGNGGGQLGTPSSTALQWNHNKNVSFPSGNLADIQTPNGNLRINRHGIMFGGANAAGKESNSAQISAGTHAPNSLNFVGMSSGAGSGDRKIKAWAEGGFEIVGPLIVNGRNILDELDNKISFAPADTSENGPWVQIQSATDRCVSSDGNTECNWTQRPRRFKLIKSGVQTRS
jgi:hypothetical protein